MTISFSFNVVLLLVGIVIGLIGAAFLFFEPKNKEANKYLGFLLLTAVAALVHNFFIASGIYAQQPNLYFIPIAYSLGTGPLLYLYVYHLINAERLQPKFIWLHLIPVGLQILFYGYCFLQNSTVKYTLYSEVFEPYAKEIINIGVYISMAFYLLFSFKEVAAYKKRLQLFYSNDAKIALTWLRSLLFVFMGYYVLLLFFIIITAAFQLSENYFPADFARTVIILMIAFYALKQNSLVEIQHNLQTVSIENIVSTYDVSLQNKNENTSLVEPANEPTIEAEYNQDLLQKIIQLIESEQLYLIEDLTIAHVAKKMNYSTRTISTTINTGLKKSFSTFINEYRINLFVEKKSSGQYEHLSIMGLAYECGFNSKSSFNRIFKEMKGFAPKAVNK